MSLRYWKMLRTFGGLLALGGGASLAMLACTSTSGYTYASETDFCTALAQAKCQPAVVSACYGTAAAPPAADTQSCISAASSSPKCNPTGLPYHPEVADQCVATATTVYATSVIARADQDQLDADCLGVFNKGLPEASRCTVDTDCQTETGFRCVMHGTSGSCRVPHEVGPAESCALLADSCAKGYYCDHGLHCVEGQQKNQACDTSKPCGNGFFCSAKGLCANQLADGAVCNEDGDCAGEPDATTGLDAGGFCTKPSDATSGRCVATLTLNATAAACDQFRQ